MNGMVKKFSNMESEMSSMQERVTKAGSLELDVETERSASKEKLSILLSNIDKCVSDKIKVSPINALSKSNVGNMVNTTKEIRNLKEQIVETKEIRNLKEQMA